MIVGAIGSQGSKEAEVVAAGDSPSTTEATVVAADDVRAVVEDDVAELVPTGLGVPCDPPPAPDLNF